MSDVSQAAVLTALQSHKELYSKLSMLLTSENYLKVLLVVDEEKLRKDMAEEAGVSTGTVSNAISELEEFGLVEETGNGYRQTLPVLGHPVIQTLFRKEMNEDD